MINMHNKVVWACLAAAFFAWNSQSEAEAGGIRGWFRYHAEDPCDMCRAGNPNYVAKRARFAYGDRYCGYYVGGGAASSRKGESRYVHEGTFGMDYRLGRQRVALDWWHGRKYQDGRGQFEPNEENEPFKTAHKDRAFRKGKGEGGEGGGGH